MKVVLFCGGLGMRLREFSENIPKPMVQIGYRPIVWHLMKYYAHFGHKDFILCLGYHGDSLKDYFLNYNECSSNDFVYSRGGKQIELLKSDIDDWRITFVDTGVNSNLGQRLMAVRQHLAGEEIFLANYSDGLADLPLHEQLQEFASSGKVATFACVKPSASFHFVSLDDKGQVRSIEDVQTADLRINGGFFAFRQEIFDYMRPGEELVEAPFQRLIERGELQAYRYNGFWMPMDTFKDKQRLDELYSKGNAPWEVWRSHPRSENGVRAPIDVLDRLGSAAVAARTADVYSRPNQNAVLSR